MSNVNKIIGYLIAGRISRGELEAYLVNQGFSPAIVDVHLARADAEVQKVQRHKSSNGNQPTPHREIYEDQQTVECDECGVTVPINFGEFCYNAETDMIFFTCNQCLQDERDY